MNDMDIEKERQLFERCVSRDPKQWNELLEAHCDDPEVRQRIRRMLDLHHDTSTEDIGFLRLDGTSPERIGPYRILQRLGEGGMGIVYAAEQREPVRRRVALKVLRGGYNNREVLARFDVERQALALMNHGNIARILDAGTTADHRPYIVMEFVPGESITRYCEHRNLSLDDRLLLFCEVCDAVQHAHQRGVIHRDLKPSNILIMEEDGRAVPKIIDFGIAKAITQRLTDQTLETKVGSLLGTPDYMSPEQAELSPLDIDTRTDVYALGAVLYKLLTGVTPLELSGSDLSYADMQKRISEQVPQPPSRHLNGPLQRKVRGELDWITGKALEKQRPDRYASAADLARDVRAHLQDGTVQAGPPSAIRKFSKFARRHWLGSLSVLSIAAILAVSQVILLQKNRELQLERDRVSAEALTSEQVTGFLLEIFEVSDPLASNAGRISARDLLDQGRRQLTDNPALDSDVRLRLYSGLGNAYAGLGLYPDAVEMHQLALEHLPSDADPAVRIAHLSRLGDSLRTAYRTVEARNVLAEAVRIASTSPGIPESLQSRARLALVPVESDLGNIERAREMVAALYDETVAQGPEGLLRRLSIGTYLANMHFMAADFSGSERLVNDLLDIARLELSETHDTVMGLRNMLGSIYAETGRERQARDIYRAVYARNVSIYGADSSPVHDAAIALAPLLDDPGEGLAILASVLQQQNEQFGADSPQSVPTLLAMGRLQSRLSADPASASPYFERALRLAIRHHGENHLATRFASFYMAAILARQGDTAAAKSVFAGVGNIPLLKWHAAVDPEFGSLREDAEFAAQLTPFLASETPPDKTGE